MKYQGVLLIGFGGPTQPKEIRPFLDNVLRGRCVPQERMEKVAGHYKTIGGKSPFNELTFRQANSLKQVLEREGPQLPVYVGMRNWHPLLPDILEQMASDGIQRAMGIILAPHQGTASWGRYQVAVQEARAVVEQKLGQPAPIIDYCEPWFIHPLFIEALADRLLCTMNTIPVDQQKQTKLLFAAHSVPSRFSHPYVEQLLKSCEAVSSKLQIVTGWKLVYQSRSGDASDPWLEPDICDVIESLSKNNCLSVLVAPIGFVCDHVEVLYDLDIEARQVAKEQNLDFYRASTVNDHPSFIRMLADVVRRAVQGHVSSKTYVSRHI